MSCLARRLTNLLALPCVCSWLLATGVLCHRALPGSAAQAAGAPRRLSDDVEGGGPGGRAAAVAAVAAPMLLLLLL